MTIFKYDLNTIVRTDHELRKISAVVDFGKIARKYVELVLRDRAGGRDAGSYIFLLDTNHAGNSSDRTSV